MYDAVDTRNDVDVADFGRRLQATLAENDYSVEAREWNDGPDMQVWTSRILQVLERWFPPGWAADGERSEAAHASSR